MVLPPNNLSINLINKLGEGNFDKNIIGVAFPKVAEDKTFESNQRRYIVGDSSYINFVLIMLVYLLD